MKPNASFGKLKNKILWVEVVNGQKQKPALKGHTISVFILLTYRKFFPVYSKRMK